MPDNSIGIEEYKSLRSEIATFLAETRTLQLYAVVGLTGYYAFLSHQIPQPFAHWTLFGGNFFLVIPILMPILGAWRTCDAFVAIGTIAKYIVEVENSFAEAGVPIGPKKGWEHFVDSERSNRPLLIAMSLSHVAVWMLLLALTIWGAVEGPAILINSAPPAGGSG